MDECTYTGKPVRVTGAGGETTLTIARSEPHLNVGMTFGRTPPWLVIAVDHPGFSDPVNWPAADVELAE